MSENTELLKEELKRAAGGRELTDEEYEVAINYCKMSSQMYTDGEISAEALAGIARQIMAYDAYSSSRAAGDERLLFDLNVDWVEKMKNSEE